MSGTACFPPKKCLVEKNVLWTAAFQNSNIATVGLKRSRPGGIMSFAKKNAL